MTYQQEISLSTKGHGEMHDLTEQVAAIVNSSGVKTGLTHVFNVGSTAALGTIEFEPGLQGDLPQFWTSSFRPAVITAMSKPGMMATATPISRQRCSAHR